ncbi:MAG: ABC transporter substrate-binding protein [Candidatus Bathyarchaeia archaeon]
MEKAYNPRRLNLMAIALIIIVGIVCGLGGYYFGLLSAQVPVRQGTIQTIKLGLVAHLTGAFVMMGEEAVRGATLAVEEINERGGVYVREYNNHLKIELIVKDDESTADGAIKAVTSLIVEENVVAIIGPMASPLTLAVEPIIAQYKVPLFPLGWGNLTDGWATVDTSTVFHNVPKTTMHAPQILQFLIEVVKPAVAPNRNLKVACFTIADVFGEGTAGSVENVIKSYGYNVGVVFVGTEKVLADQTDFTASWTKIKALKPDVVIVTVNNPMAVVQARRDVGLNCLYILWEHLNQAEYWEAVGEWGDGMLLHSSSILYATPRNYWQLHFREAYMKRWGKLPGLAARDPYEDVYIVAKAIEEAGTLNKTKIIDSLKNLKMPEMCKLMVDRTIKFDELRRVDALGWMEQAYMTPQGLRMEIIWPHDLALRQFKVPDYYRPAG